MARGLSLHVGLNSVDPTVYKDDYGRPWSGDLDSPEFDASDMYALATSSGFDAATLLTHKATAERILAAIEGAAQQLGPGDVYFLTYSGHGGQVQDENGEEPDGRDETWAVFDRQLLDDEIFAALTRFEPGVRVFVLSDSCHSGSVLKAMPDFGHLAGRLLLRSADGRRPRAKRLPLTVQARDNQVHGGLYREIQSRIPDSKTTKDKIRATALLISGCKDSEASYDGPRNGAFTTAVLETWSSGQFVGNYADFYQQVAGLLAARPPLQTPQWFPIGVADSAFYGQHPLTI